MRNRVTVLFLLCLIPCIIPSQGLSQGLKAKDFLSYPKGKDFYHSPKGHYAYGFRNTFGTRGGHQFYQWYGSEKDMEASLTIRGELYKGQFINFKNFGRWGVYPAEIRRQFCFDFVLIMGATWKEHYLGMSEESFIRRILLLFARIYNKGVAKNQEFLKSLTLERNLWLWDQEIQSQDIAITRLRSYFHKIPSHLEDPVMYVVLKKKAGMQLFRVEL